MYVQYSILETVRRERHGVDSRLDLLKKVTGGYAVITTLAERFYIGRQFSTKEGQYVVVLTVDRPANFTAENIRDWIFVDLRMPGESTMRYRLQTETRPNTLEKRWIIGLSAAFNDTTPIVV